MRRSLLLSAGILAVAACSDSLPVETSTGAPSLNLAAAPAASRYAVLLKGGATKFAEQAAALGGTVELLHERSGIAIVSGLSDAAARTLETSNSVDLVVEDFQYQGVSNPIESMVEIATGTSIVGDAQSQANPATAVFYPRQWHLRAIGADRAWAAGRLGSPAVDVFILDSGIDQTYIDLTGLVDMSRAKSFVPSDDALIARFFPGRVPTSDLNGHGSHVASTVASRALANAGVTSRVTLVPVKVLGATGSGSFTGILNGLLYAADQQADVVNASVGALFPRRGEHDFTKLLDAVTRYARKAGVTIVVAAGNDGAELHPSQNALYGAFCSTKNVICVSATGPNAGPLNGPWTGMDRPAIYTNYGQQHVDVAAPGGNYAVNEKGEVVSAIGVWAACSKTTLVFDKALRAPGQPANEAPKGDWKLHQCAAQPQFTFTLGNLGTSMASPHVAGLAALLVEQYGRNPGAITAAIQNSADDVREFGKPGTDDFFGHGRINVARALGL
jgi:subtilisin family serine protease